MKKLFLILTLLTSYASIYAEKIIPVYFIAITQDNTAEDTSQVTSKIVVTSIRPW